MTPSSDWSCTILHLLLSEPQRCPHAPLCHLQARCMAQRTSRGECRRPSAQIRTPIVLRASDCFHTAMYIMALLMIDRKCREHVARRMEGPGLMATALAPVCIYWLTHALNVLVTTASDSKMHILADP